MRIYNKRNFAAGILSLALAVACGVVLAVTGFQTKWLIALVLLLAGGGLCPGSPGSRGWMSGTRPSAGKAPGWPTGLWLTAAGS